MIGMQSESSPTSYRSDVLLFIDSINSLNRNASFLRNSPVIANNATSAGNQRPINMDRSSDEMMNLILSLRVPRVFKQGCHEHVEDERV